MHLVIVLDNNEVVQFQNIDWPPYCEKSVTEALLSYKDCKNVTMKTPTIVERHYTYKLISSNDIDKYKWRKATRERLDRILEKRKQVSR